MKITYEGPVRQPTKAMISFSGNLPDFLPGQSEAKTSRKVSDKEKYQSETQRIAEEQRRFREGMKSPGQIKTEENEAWETMRRLNRINPDPLGLGHLTTAGFPLTGRAAGEQCATWPQQGGKRLAKDRMLRKGKGRPSKH
jgi:hypothetical protein